jgi:hypothetical protein
MRNAAGTGEKNKTRKMAGLCLTAVVFFLFQGQTAQRPLPGAMPQAENGPRVLYRFSEHLADARTGLYIPGRGETRPGKWDGEQLIFENLSPAFAVQKAVRPFGEELRQGIGLRIIPSAVRFLSFRNVPPGSTLVVYSGVSDAGTTAAGSGEPAMIYLTVWAGIHRLAKIPVSTEPGWNSVPLDLGVVSFLRKNIVVTFEMTMDDRVNRSFLFDAEILD